MSLLYLFKITRRGITTNRYSMMALLLLGILPFLFVINAVNVQAEVTFGFCDTSDLILDWDELAANNGELKIKLCNYTENQQWVKLCLQNIGAVSGEVIQPPAEDVYIMNGTLEQQQLLAAHAENQEYTLIIDTSRRPPTSETQFRLLAKSDSGEEATRKLILKVGRPEDVPESSLYFLPDKLDSLNFKGTNIVPSFINPLKPSLLFFTVICFVLWLALNLAKIFYYKEYGNLRKKFKEKQKIYSHWQKVLWLCHNLYSPIDCFLIIAIVCFVTFSFLYCNNKEYYPAHVSIEPVKVSTVDFAQVGMVVSDDGRLGSIQQIGNELRVSGVRKAGHYAGKTELPGNESIETKVLVSDHWFYPFMIISAGVILGFYITWHHSKQRENENIHNGKSDNPKVQDWQIGAVVGLLAVGSGFVALYLKDAPYWGSYMDYLTAFLWGAIGSQGLKYAGNVISRFKSAG